MAIPIAFINSDPMRVQEQVPFQVEVGTES